MANDFQAYNVLLCSRCRFFTMNPDRHRRELGMGHSEAYIGHCSGWNQDVRMLDTDGGCNREMNCPFYKLLDKKMVKRSIHA